MEYVHRGLVVLPESTTLPYPGAVGEVVTVDNIKRLPSIDVYLNDLSFFSCFLSGLRYIFVDTDIISTQAYPNYILRSPLSHPVVRTRYLSYRV